MGGFWGRHYSRSLGGRMLGGHCLLSLGGRMMGRTLLKKLRWEDAGEDAAQEA